MSFVGYIAQRMSGAAGYPLTGLLGGLVSSTSVTLTFARLSKSHPQQERPLAIGAVAASTVLFLRVAVAVAILERDAPAGPGALSGRAVCRGDHRASRSHGDRCADRASTPPTLKNPLQFLSAIEMAMLFQVVLFAVYLLRAVDRRRGPAGERFRARPDRRRCADAVDDAERRDRHDDRSARAARSRSGIIANSLMKAGIAVDDRQPPIRVAGRRVADRRWRPPARPPSS